MNVFLWVLFAVFVLLILLLLTPLHAEITYCADGFSLALRFLFLRFRIPHEKKSKKIAQPKEEQPKQKQGGNLKRLVSLIRLGISVAGKLLSKIQIHNLKIDATVASNDPFQTAMMFGGSGVAVGILLPLIEQNFKLKKRTVNVVADFETKESKVFLFADCSALVINLLAIALCFAYNFWKEQKMKTPDKRKDDLNGRSESE